MAGEGDLGDFLILNVKGEPVRLFFLRRFIMNSEDCPKVNIKIWNLDCTGQSLALPVICEHHSSLGLLHTWKSVQENQDVYSEDVFRKERERNRQRKLKYLMCSNEDTVQDFTLNF